MKALALCHESKQDLGRFVSVLKTRGIEVDYVMGYQDKLVTIDPEAHDLAIFMGGSMGVYQTDLFPYIQNEINYLKKRISADKPTLGICLGAQMIAKAMGKNVYVGKRGKEIGWLNINISEAGKNHPIHHFNHDKTPIIQLHGDTFDLPEEATLLASSDMYPNQAFSIGKNILGLQFHPEMTEDNIETHMISSIDELSKHGVSIPKFRAETQEKSALLNQQTTKFLNDWLDMVTT